MIRNVQFTSCSTYWGCKESLLGGWLGAGPEAGVMGRARVCMEWEVSAGEVRWWGRTRWSWTFRTQTATFTVTAAVAAAGRRCWWHLQRLTQPIYICHSNQHQSTINAGICSMHRPKHTQQKMALSSYVIEENKMRRNSSSSKSALQCNRAWRYVNPTKLT